MLFRRGSESQLVLHCSSRTTTFESVTLFLSTPNSDFSVISHEKKTKKNSDFWNFFSFFWKNWKNLSKINVFTIFEHIFRRSRKMLKMRSMLFNCKSQFQKSLISSLKFNLKYQKKIEFRLHFSRSQGPPVFKPSHTGKWCFMWNFKIT